MSLASMELVAGDLVSSYVEIMDPEWGDINVDGIDSEGRSDEPLSGGRNSKIIRPEITPEELAALEMPVPPQQDPVTAGVTVPLERRQPQEKQLGTDQIRISAYIRQDTYAQIIRTLRADKRCGSLSELIEELLNEWLSRR